MAGAIFARGSCRALRWMALFGVVFAVGVGGASAQTVAVEPGVKLTTLYECTAPGFLDTRLRYAAWRSSYCWRASSGVRYASFSRRQHWL